MKILVCGGRDFARKGLLKRCLTMAHGKYNITCVVHGGCKGADELAKDWAISNNIEHKEYTADWNKFGPRAGPIRNAQMLDDNTDIELVIAFPGGRGTLDMITKARTKNIKVIEVETN